MENNVKEKNNNGIIIAILCILLLASIGFICYDKLLKKEEPKSSDCNCPVCEKCTNVAKQDIKLKTCTLDMNGKTTIDVEDNCSDVGYSNVIIKNIKIADKLYEFKFVLDGLSNVLAIDGSVDEDSYNYENSVVKLYINDKLIDAFPGEYSYDLMNFKVENGKITVKVAFPSDVPPVDHTYDLSNFD